MWRICSAPSRHYNPTYRQAGRPLYLPPPESGPAFLSPAPVVLGRIRTSQARSSKKFALRRRRVLLLGGRHRRGAAHGQPTLGSQDDRRVHRLHPPELRGWPLLYRLLKRGRLDHQLAGVDHFCEPLLLLYGLLQFDGFHPVEGGPNGASLAGFLLDEPHESILPPLAQGALLYSHE